ncbi:hypothetical protein Q8A73_012963 [Channa argus]|nr:hypothetical protein Q8A73_012963 [Channa argus]
MFCRPWRLLKIIMCLSYVIEYGLTYFKQKKSQGGLEDRNKKRSSQHKRNKNIIIFKNEDTGTSTEDGDEIFFINIDINIIIPNYFSSSLSSVHIPRCYSSSPVKTLMESQRILKSLGKNIRRLPNLAQTCYMNSTLQALLTLSPFIEEVSRQETIWRSHYSSHLTRGFVDLRVCRLSNKIKKKSILVDIKRTVARFNAEFADDNQKDAHEFLSCVLDMLRLMSSDLQRLAKTMGLRYTCPVTEHILFKMLNMRTCKGCGIQFGREEDHINLLLVPVGSVTQCLKEYLKEHEVSYCCDCGAEISSQQRLFLTLPNVLILQLKRFRFTETFDLKKVKSPIILSRELEVNPVSSSSEQMRYSLVSIISHLGSTAHAGHYVCDGAYRDTSVGTTDCWLTYNDKKVSERTGASVCQQRAKTAYLLFYEKQL